MSIIYNENTRNIETRSWEYYNKYISSEVNYKNCEILYTNDIQNDVHHLEHQNLRPFDISGTAIYNDKMSRVYIQYDESNTSNSYLVQMYITTIHELTHIHNDMLLQEHNIAPNANESLNQYYILWHEFQSYYTETIHLPKILSYIYYTNSLFGKQEFDMYVNDIYQSKKRIIDFIILFARLYAFETINKNELSNHFYPNCELTLQETLNAIVKDTYYNNFYQLYNLLRELNQQLVPAQEQILKMKNLVDSLISSTYLK